MTAPRMELPEIAGERRLRRMALGFLLGAVVALLLLMVRQ